MQIKMTRFYHGQLLPEHNGLRKGRTYDIEDDVAKELVIRGYAEDVTVKTRAAQAATSEESKPASRRKTTGSK